MPDNFSRAPRGVRGPWLATTALVAAASLWLGGQSAAERVAPPAGQGPLWISDGPLDEGRRLLIVIDHATRHAAVYHVDGLGGTMTLKSTRNIAWDLMVGDFNAQEPRPAALQRMLQIPPPPTPR